MKFSMLATKRQQLHEEHDAMNSSRHIAWTSLTEASSDAIAVVVIVAVVVVVVAFRINKRFRAVSSG